MAKIRVKAGGVEVTVVLNDSKTAGLLAEALPFDTKVQV